jgi:cobalt/nickel transport system permease protein
MLVAAGLLVVVAPATAFAMHIPEGVLPPQWAGLWYLTAIPFVLWGVRDLRIRSAQAPRFKPMVSLMGAAVFVISCMPIPVPIAGTCSHPCGTGLAAILIGPTLTVLVTSVALLLQALFLSHGGLTTLGANIMSMGVVGAFSGYAIFHLARRARIPVLPAAFLAGLLSDWMTYAMTSFELASALHGAGSMAKMFVGIAIAFIPTQLPLGILEGVISAGVYRFITSRRPDLLESLRQVKAGVA